MRVDGLCPEGCGRLTAAGCVEGLRKKVLRIDRPDGRRVLKFDGPSGRGLRIALWAMLMKSALRINLSASYGKITILLTGSLRSPPPFRLRRTFPHPGDRINRSMLPCRDMTPWLSTHSAPACGGKVVAPATKGGLHFQRPQGGCMVFAAKGGIRNGARKRRTSPAQRYYITPEGESPQPVREASAGPGQNPGSPGPKGPAAGSTLTPVRACQPSGIPESTAPVPIPTAP